MRWFPVSAQLIQDGNKTKTSAVNPFQNENETKLSAISLLLN
jgi:hypothetical protein